MFRSSKQKNVPTQSKFTPKQTLTFKSDGINVGYVIRNRNRLFKQVGFENKPPGPDGFFECMWFGSNEVAFLVLPMGLDPIQLYHR